MSNLSWQSSLVQTAERLRPRDRPLRIAVVGVGHELRGDDAAGVVAARSLIAALADPTAKNATPQQEAGQADAAATREGSAPFAVRSGTGRDESRQSQRSQVLVIDAGPAPENHTGSLRRFQPDLVILVDAAQMGEPPGAIRWLRWQDTDGLSASTHTLPLHVLAQYLTVDLGCQVALLGIQPAGTCIGAPLSPTAHLAVERIVNVLDGLNPAAPHCR